jgi:hypothetical protein
MEWLRSEGEGAIGSYHGASEGTGDAGGVTVDRMYEGYAVAP